MKENINDKNGNTNNKKGSVLIISNMYPSKRYKHYGVFVKNTEKILKNNGYKTDISVLRKKDSKLGKLAGYLFFYLKSIFKLAFIEYDYVYVHYVAHCAILIILADYLQNTKRKKMHLKNSKICKIVINVHGNDVVPEDKKDEKFIPLVKKALKHIDCCITPSKYFSKIMIETYGLNKNIVKTYPSGGVDLNVFRSVVGVKEKLGISKDTVTIGYVGRYEIGKGWDIFLKAVEKVLQTENINKKIQVIMVGTGTEETKVTEMTSMISKKHTVPFKMFQMKTQEELAEIYSAIDIFCFPTYRKSESLGLVGLEAMASGSIVIASNMAGPTSYIEDKTNGFFFEPKNFNDLSNKIINVMNLKENKKTSIQANAIEKVKEYDVQKAADNLINIFKSI